MVLDPVLGLSVNLTCSERLTAMSSDPDYAPTPAAARTCLQLVSLLFSDNKWTAFVYPDVCASIQGGLQVEVEGPYELEIEIAPDGSYLIYYEHEILCEYTLVGGQPCASAT